MELEITPQSPPPKNVLRGAGGKPVEIVATMADGRLVPLGWACDDGTTDITAKPGSLGWSIVEQTIKDGGAEVVDPRK